MGFKIHDKVVDLMGEVRELKVRIEHLEDFKKWVMGGLIALAVTIIGGLLYF